LRFLSKNLVINLEDNPVIPVLTGCTATGKTGVLLKFRRKYDFEIISADSRQVYRGMDIGTAKPERDEQAILTHHLIDCINPDETFSAGMFTKEAWRLVSEIRKRNSVPVVAGGTALYLIALAGGLDPMPNRCEGVREGFKTIEEEMPGTLHRILEKLDPVTAGVTGNGDIRRLVRALELYALTGELPSDLRKGGDPMLRKKFRMVGISLPRDEHRRRIRVRAENMMETGLIEEVRFLLDKGWGRESVLGRTIGYKEVLDFLDGIITSVEGIVEAVSVNTWQLVRRQKNMFKRLEGIVWVENDPDLIEKLLFAEGGF